MSARPQAHQGDRPNAAQPPSQEAATARPAPPRPAANAPSAKPRAATPHPAEPRAAGRTSRDHRTWKAQLDVTIAASLALVAALATALPPGALRIVLTLPVLLFVPGYILIHALRPTAAARPIHDAVLGVGLSLPLVALAALATSLVPGGFTATAIVVSVTVTCVALAAVAVVRRRRLPVAHDHPHAVASQA